MKSYYLIDSKDLMEIADNIRNAGGLTFSSQEFTISNYMQDLNNNNEYGYTWYRIIYGGSSQPSPGYSFSVELEGALATDIIQIDSISSAFNYDIQVRASRNYNNTKDTISVTIYSGENEVSGECTITGTLYHTGTGTGTVTIPAGETSAGEAPSNKLEWPNGFVSAIQNLSTSTIGLEYFFTDALPSIINIPDISYIKSYCFAERLELQEVNFQNCNTIGSYAFCSCLSLSFINLPKCSDIRSGAFENCMELTSINLSPNISALPVLGFHNCINLTSINLPNCDYMGVQCFEGCSNLINISMPNITLVAESAFKNCISLSEINFPECLSIFTYAFSGCINLETVSIPKCEIIKAYAFWNCEKLASIYLTNTETVTSLSNINAFTSTPFSDNTGNINPHIYVPASLYDQYIIASNWSLISNYIVSVG